MYRRISRIEAQRLIRAIICIALRSVDNTIHINNIRLIPKAIIVEAGKILKYEVELYTVDENLLKATVKEIVLSVQYNEKIAELTIALDDEAGHIYFIPSSIANEQLLGTILDFLRSKADC